MKNERPTRILNTDGDVLKPRTRELPPLMVDPTGDIVVNVNVTANTAVGETKTQMIAPRHPRTVQGGTTVDLSDIRAKGEPLDVAKFINDRRSIIFVGRTRLDQRQITAFNKLWAPLEVLSIGYGQSIQGYRANVIVILDPPYTSRESDWLHKELRLRLSKDGLWIEAF